MFGPVRITARGLSPSRLPRLRSFGMIAPSPPLPPAFAPAQARQDIEGAKAELEAAKAAVAAAGRLQSELEAAKAAAETSARVQAELDAAKARPAIEMGARIKAALDKGDWATFNKLTGVTAKPGETKFEAIPPGVQYGMLTENGQTRVLNLQEMVKAQAAAAAASQEEAEARRRAGMQ
jgi:hypothetical protein